MIVKLWMQLGYAVFVFSWLVPGHAYIVIGGRKGSFLGMEPFSVLEFCSWPWLFAIGMLAGSLAALMGVGGGIVMTPFLNVLGVPMVVAVPNVMGCIAISSSLTSWSNARASCYWENLD